jgi:hypothetical protein
MTEDVRMPSFAEVAERRAEGKVVELPADIGAHQLLQMEYRGQIVLTHGQRSAAKECLPFETPKLGVVATTNMTGDDFSAMLDRAIARSQVRVIEHRQDEGAKPSPAPLPPHGTPRQGPTIDRRFRRS